MRLLQINGNGTGDAVLDFHPMVTVITGLDAAGRDTVVRAVTALPSGADPGVGGLLEVHGLLLDLDADTLRLLGLHSDLDVLVRRADLPGHRPAPAPPPVAAVPVERHHSRAEIQEFIDATPTGEHEALDHARRRQADSQAALAVFQEAVATSRAEFERVRAEQRMAQATLDAARASTGPRLRLISGDGDAEGPSAEEIRAERAALTARADELEAQLATIARGLQELTSIDTRPVQVLIDALRNPQPIEYIPSERAQELAGEFVELQGRVNELEEALEAEGQGSASALRQLEAARAELADAERAMAKPELTGDDVAELEAAHEAVLEAEKRATGPFKRGGQKKLDEARQRERAVLDRVGFPTWSAYVMGASLLAIDHSAEQRLEKARLDVETAEAHWAVVAERIQGDPEHAQLLERMEAVYVEAYDLLGGAEPDDLEQALRGLQVPKREVTTEELVEALNYQLELVGLQLGEAPSQDLVIMAADAFLEEAGAVSGRIEELRAEQGDAQAALAVARQQLADLPDVPEPQPVPEELAPPQAAGGESDPWGVEAPSASTASGSGSAFEEFDPSDPFGLGAEAEVGGPGPPPDLAPVEDGPVETVASEAGPDAEDVDLADLEKRLDDATAEVAEYQEWLESREALLDAAIQVESVATSRLMKTAGDLLAEAEPELVEPEPEAAPEPAAWEGSLAGEDASVESIEFYLLARLAAQRSVAIAGSVPLVVDDALAGLPSEDVEHVMHKLEQMAETVQIIYLTDDGDVTGWAERAGIRKAAIVPAPAALG